MKHQLVSIGLITALFTSCSITKNMKSIDKKKLSAHDTVMSAGQEVLFKNPNGSGKIIYLSDFMRRYEIDGVKYDVKLMQRTDEWMHKKGIYNPADTWGPLPLSDAIPSRFVVEDSEVRFNTNEEVERFFKEGAEYHKWVSGEKGLVLGFFSSPGRDQVNVSLHRCYIAGKLMKRLPAQFKHKGYVRLISKK